MLARRFGISRKSGGHPQGDMHMVAARLGFERAMVGTRWATSRPDSMDRLSKHYSHLVGKAAWFWVGIRLPKVLTIACSLMRGHGQSHKSTFYGQKRTWAQFWSQSLDRNGDKVRKIHV